MKIEFSITDRQKILANIENALKGRKLGELVTFKLVPGGLEVVISKMGTSTLSFQESVTEAGVTYTLSKEKIAFAHKAFKSEVEGKIFQIVSQAGGKVQGVV